VNWFLIFIQNCQKLYISDIVVASLINQGGCMKPISVYLAGPFMPWGEFPDWRDYVKEKLKDKQITFYDPRFDTDQGSIATFVSQDLAGVENTDCTFYFMDRSNGDAGAIIELAHGNAKKKLTILCIDKEIGFVHPMILGISRRAITGLDVGIIYLENLANVGIENEFQASYKTMQK